MCDIASVLSPLVEDLARLAGSPRIAVRDDRGETSFAALLDAAHRVQARLCRGAGSLEGERVALLASPGALWIQAFVGVILAGGVVLPLSPLYPTAELTWLLNDAGVQRLIVSDDLAGVATPLAEGMEVLRAADLVAPHPARPRTPDVDGGAPALLLYTSGTTGRPKGALLTHANLSTQAALLRAAWGFTEDDALLHALPLHHMHGVCIALLTALLAGSGVRLLPRFDVERFAAEIARRSVTSFMAVPTMYARLLERIDGAGDRAEIAAGARALRLATSGSAALPVTLAERWRDLTGAIPLERFGMTEIGVGMSNPLDPGGRRAGWVGTPLPTVEARLVGDDGADTARGPGELWIRGPSVFQGYLDRPDATAAAFRDGWFCTGDVAERAEDGYVRLLGRTSIDILKSGGYKLSALEIEEQLREHPAVAEVAVIGVPDEAWGDRVVAVVVPAPGRAAECATEPLRAWAKERLAAYKVPREVIVVSSLPRNAVGKVIKPDLLQSRLRGTWK